MQYSFSLLIKRKRGTVMHHREHRYKKKDRPLPEYISVISASNCAKIRIDDIEVIEQDGRKLHVVTSGKDYSFYGGLNTIAESLAESVLQTHKKDDHQPGSYKGYKRLLCQFQFRTVHSNGKKCTGKYKEGI